MPYVSSHFHIVYSTKGREPSIPEKIQPKLWAYMAGIAKNHGILALAIGGIEDHLHALISLPATMSIARAVQLLKANSSRWMNEHRPTRFEWQEGYFACSVSRSQIPRASKYIANRREHHRKRDFAAEIALLSAATPASVSAFKSPFQRLSITPRLMPIAFRSRKVGVRFSFFAHRRIVARICFFVIFLVILLVIGFLAKEKPSWSGWPISEWLWTKQKPPGFGWLDFKGLLPLQRP